MNVTMQGIRKFQKEITKPIYVFLDIDGVLNFQAMYEEEQYKDQLVISRDCLGEARECLVNLFYLLRDFPTSRIVERFNKVFDTHLWKERIIGVTGEYGDTRGYQIRDWLEKNAGMTGFSTKNMSKEAYVVCIDDQVEGILLALNWQYVVQTRFMWPFRGFDYIKYIELIGCLMYQHRQMKKNPDGVIEL